MGTVRARGEPVHQRCDPENRGTGQAIDWFLGQNDLAACDAVALFDADNLVEPDFFRAMARELAAGARCLQGYYDIANPDESAMTRLLSLTFVLKNLFYNGGKRVLGLSVSLMGTGMVFAADVLATGGWRAKTIAEDLEQTLNLIERGERILYVHDARTRVQESHTLRQGAAQRQRWASGRRNLRARAWALVGAGLRGGSLRQIDSGLDLLVPGYSKLGYLSAAAGLMAVGLLPWSVVPLACIAPVFAYQAVELGAATRRVGVSWRMLLALAVTPVFFVWKAVIDGLAVIGYRRGKWTRTDRVRHHDS